MKICPNCGNVISSNSYFGKYLCSKCGYEESIKDDVKQKKSATQIIKILEDNIHNFNNEEIKEILNIIKNFKQETSKVKDDDLLNNMKIKNNGGNAIVKSKYN